MKFINMLVFLDLTSKDIFLSSVSPSSSSWQLLRFTTCLPCHYFFFLTHKMVLMLQHGTTNFTEIQACFQTQDTCASNSWFGVFYIYATTLFSTNFFSWVGDTKVLISWNGFYLLCNQVALKFGILSPCSPGLGASRFVLPH